MIETLRAEGPLLVLEGGNSLVKRGEGAGKRRAERRRKADLIAQAWALGGLDGLAVGEYDWALGSDFVRELVARHELPLLAANLTCDGAQPYPGTRVIEVGAVAVGLVGATRGEVDGCEVSAAAPAVRAAMEAVGEPVDVWVGLMPLATNELQAVVDAAPELRVVVDGHSGRRQHVPKPQGGAWVVSAGSRSKYLGGLRLTLEPGATAWRSEGGAESLASEVERLETRLTTAEANAAKATDAKRVERYQRQVEAYGKRLAEKRAELEALQTDDGAANVLTDASVDLSRSVADHAATLQAVEALLAELADGTGTSGAAINAMLREGPEGSSYAGASACRSCHEEAYAQWGGTPHAHAWASLIEDKRALDSDCWSCHSTGANLPDGPAFAAEVGGLHDVQCEACHGPAAQHAADPASAVKPIGTPDRATCTGCHDGEQDGGRFELESYWPRVVHGTAPF